MKDKQLYQHSRQRSHQQTSAVCAANVDCAAALLRCCRRRRCRCRRRHSAGWPRYLCISQIHRNRQRHRQTRREKISLLQFAVEREASSNATRRRQRTHQSRQSRQSRQSITTVNHAVNHAFNHPVNETRVSVPLTLNGKCILR